MIERFSLQAEIYDVMAQFNVNKVLQGHSLRYNVSPTQLVTVIMNDRHEQRVVNEARWGLFPFWAKDAINTTNVDIARKSFLFELVKRNRCVIPCTGFYGAKTIGTEKQPRAMHIVVPGKPLFGIAAIFDCFRNTRGQEYRAFSLLTSSTTGTMSTWQPSLPVVLDAEGVERWLDPKIRDMNSLNPYLTELESYQLRAYPVTNAINDDKYESPDCVRELSIDYA